MAKKKNQIVARSQRGQGLPEMSEDEARAHLESLLWPDGPVCPHCNSTNAYKMQGETCRAGLHRCRDCEKQFTVTVGTIFEDSHLPLAKWVKAFHLMCSSKKGISALQLQRNLGLGSYRTAWHMAHRIRLAMRCEPFAGALRGIVESDESYCGGVPRKKHLKGPPLGRGVMNPNKTPIHSLVERGPGGRKRTRVIASVTAASLKKNLTELVDKSASLHTDQQHLYRKSGREFADHRKVNHSIYEYQRVDKDGVLVTTNTVESSFSLIKRGLYGTFHRVSAEHLQRYMDEFDFRWDNREVTDVERRTQALMQVKGKRLTYRQPEGEMPRCLDDAAGLEND